MSQRRSEKINELLKTELSIICQKYLENYIFSVTEVVTSSDLSHSKVYISSLNDDGKVVVELNSLSKEIRKELAEKVILRKIPNLHFVLDLRESYGRKIDKILEEI